MPVLLFLPSCYAVHIRCAVVYSDQYFVRKKLGVNLRPSKANPTTSYLPHPLYLSIRSDVCVPEAPAPRDTFTPTLRPPHTYRPSFIINTDYGTRRFSDKGGYLAQALTRSLRFHFYFKCVCVCTDSDSDSRVCVCVLFCVSGSRKPSHPTPR